MSGEPGIGELGSDQSRRDKPSFLTPIKKRDNSEAATAQPDRVNTGVTIDRSNKTAVLIEDAIHVGGGRIPYSKFMEISLFGPEGYYSSGKAKINEEEGGGDFKTTTKYKRFGACMGISAVKTWEAMGKPDRFRIIEMGAGTGQLAKNLLVWARENEPAFYNALTYTILEYGELIAKQKKTIGGLSNSTEDHASNLAKVQWVQGSAHQLPFRDVEGMFISNELPDAFSVEIVKRINGEVKQKYVTLEEDKWVERWDEPSPEVQKYITHYGSQLKLSEDNEEAINFNAINWQHGMNRALKRGVIITVDYGICGEPKEGTRKKATRTYPQRFDLTYPEYRSPGNFDITSDPNFNILQQDQEELENSVIFSGEQAEFLMRNGYAELVQPDINAFHLNRSLKNRGYLIYDLEEESKLLGKKNFFAQIVTKGVNIDMPPPNQNFHELFDFPFTLKIGKPKSKYFIHINEKIYEVLSDDEGKIVVPSNIDPLFLTNVFSQRTITDETGVIIADSTDEEQVVSVYKNSGYDFDLPRYAFSLGEPNRLYTITIRNQNSDKEETFRITSDEGGRISLWAIGTKYDASYFLKADYLHSTITDDSGQIIFDSSKDSGAVDDFLQEHLIDMSLLN